MKPCLSFAGVLLLAGGMLTVSGCGEPTAAEPTSAEDSPSADASNLDRVTAGQAERKTLELYTSQPGRIAAFEETPLYSKVTGYVEEVLVDIGDVVEKDQVLIKLWIPELEDELKEQQALVEQAEAQVKQAEAELQAMHAAVDTAEARVSQAEAGVARAEADFQRWQSEHERMKDLTSRGSLSQKLADETLNQFRSSEAAREEASAKVRSVQAELAECAAHIQKAEADKIAAQAKAGVARAELARAETMWKYTEIKAPYDGVITRRNVDTRHYVHPANGGTTKPLLVVAQTDKVRIFVDVPEMEASLVDGGENADPAVVRVQSLRGQEFETEVTRTSWSLDASNRSLKTEIDIDNEDGVLRPGMYATAKIRLERREETLTLPVSAIVREGRDAYCCLVESGTIKRHKLTLGLRSGEDVEVLDGLNQDQTVVLARANSLEDGQPVEVIESDKED